VAFYSPDHPLYEERLVVPNTERLPLQTTFKRGWAALCFEGDTGCIASMQRTAARASRFVRSQFVLKSTLLGRPGVTQGFTALVVPPSLEGPITPSPGGGVEDFSAIALASGTCILRVCAQRAKGQCRREKNSEMPPYLPHNRSAPLGPRDNH